MQKPSAWRVGLPGLAELSTSVSAVLDRDARPVSYDRGAVIFGPENPPDTLVFLMSGTVRVQQFVGATRDVVLYRCHAKDSCLLTAACLLAFEDRSAEGIAETDIQAVLLPRDTFNEAMITSQEFRGFVFETYAKRISALFSVIEENVMRDRDALARLVQPTRSPVAHLRGAPVPNCTPSISNLH